MLRLELMVNDLDASLAFYTEVLEFAPSDDGGGGTYRPLHRGDVRVSLQDITTLPPDHPLVTKGGLGGGIEVVLEVDDVVGFHDRVSRSWPVDTELGERPWGATDFRVTDPDGYYWRVTDHTRT